MNILSTQVDDADSRRSVLLVAAVGVFARYGYRKASMEEVARAADVSRQGLYLLFESKAELFREALAHSLRTQLTAAISALTRRGDSLESRLVAAFDAWSGRFVGSMGSDSLDLMCASTSLAGATLSAYESQFEEAVTHAIAASRLELFCATAGLCPADLARALHATARGLKHGSILREDFVKGMAVAAKMFCAPLQQFAPDRGFANG